jgi:hypothetical protein
VKVIPLLGVPDDLAVDLLDLFAKALCIEAHRCLLVVEHELQRGRADDLGARRCSRLGRF